MKKFTKCTLFAMLIPVVYAQARHDVDVTNHEEVLASASHLHDKESRHDATHEEIFTPAEHETGAITRYIKDVHTIRFSKTAAIIAAIDGLRGVMDGKEIAKAIEVGRKLHVLQHGIYDPKTKKYTPQHIFNGKAYTLKGLINIEKTTEAKLKNHPSYAQIKQEQKKLLEKVKKDFEDITAPYLASSAKGSQDQMMAFISEFCELAQRTNSQLLKWKKGEEFKSLREHVQSFEILDSLCTDLTDFLKVLARSFPKALAQYNKMQNKPH